MRKMLIADDNKQILDILKHYAESEDFQVLTAENGREALDLFSEHDFSIILLDVLMPEVDGFTVCKKIRETSMVPVIIVTARGEDYERIMGLEIGADDYIVKPFVPGEVMARVKAILRRVGGDLPQSNENNQISFDNLYINMDTFTVKVNGEKVNLTKKEIEIIWLLVKSPNKVFTRDDLLDLIWGYDYYGDTRTVDSHIKRLRAKLSKYDHEKWEIKTVWGTGYKFEVNIEK